ncbi:MAG: flagellar hook protein, partial [Lachnospiraceae bacterium]|nr:flagellar hook protein [Lachnospiraceae bacterium]
MAMRISGINSGLDTEAMVQELVKAYSSKTDTLKKEQTKAEWKQDAYKSLNTKVKSLFSKLGNLQYSAAYSKKTTNVSDSSKVSVVTSDNAVSGTQTIEVNKMAKSGYLTGGELKRTDGKKVTADTKLSDLGFTGDKSTISLTKGDGTKVNFDVDQNMKVSDVVNKLSSAGVNANFDSATGRLFVSSKDSGAANDFTLSGSGIDGAAALTALGLTTSKDASFKQGRAIDF